MIIIDKNNAKIGGAPDVIIAELALVIRSVRKQLGSGLPYLDTDNMVRDAIRIGMMSDEDFEKILDDQRKKILGEE